jgi:hypothetical protein
MSSALAPLDAPLARNIPRAKVRVLKRVDGMTMRAVEVLGELLESGTDAVRLAAAKEILDRRFGRPRASAAGNGESHSDPGAMHLEALRILAERGLKAAEDAGVAEPGRLAP